MRRCLINCNICALKLLPITLTYAATFSKLFDFFFSKSNLKPMFIFPLFSSSWKNTQFEERLCCEALWQKLRGTNMPLNARVSTESADRKAQQHTWKRGRASEVTYRLLCFLDFFFFFLLDGCHWSSSGKWIKHTDSLYNACLPAISCLFQSL